MSLLVQSELQGLLNIALKEQGRLRKGNNLTYHCPFCHHRKRKLEVCLDDQNWHCWVCDAKGRSIFTLFKKMRVSDSTMARLEKVVPYEAPRVRDVVVDVTPYDKPIQLPTEFKSLMEPCNTIGYKLAHQYARKRRLTTFDIIKHNIGYCDAGEYKDRLIFPSYDANNQLNFFTGRSYYDDVYLKYKNPEADRNIVGFENMIDFNFPISLCEGALDAIAIKRNAIPLFGKTPSNKLRLILATDQVEEIFIVLDNDALEMSISMSEYLISQGKIVHLVNLQGKDPNVLGFAETTRQIRETPVLDFSALMKLKLKL